MISKRIIKVCGMREGANILAVDALRVEMMGFIFYARSPRYVATLPCSMPQLAKRVGVFVDDSIGSIGERVEQFGLDYVQLHGSETPQFCEEVRALGVKVIKAFSVDAEFDFEQVNGYSEFCDLFVFDTKCSCYGGSGEQFEWSLLHKYRGSTPFLLSGGIGAQSAQALATFDHPRLVGYDLNSLFEVAPALKDVELLTQFFAKLKDKKYE